MRSEMEETAWRRQGSWWVCVREAQEVDGVCS